MRRRPTGGGSGLATNASTLGRRTTRSSGACGRGGYEAGNGGAGCCDHRRLPAAGATPDQAAHAPPALGGWDREARETPSA